MTFVKSVDEIKVALDFGTKQIAVGRLAINNRKIYFEYALDFIDRHIEISPFKLPLQPGLQTFEHRLFEGLPGVFNDSLPDGWGRFLFDRLARSINIPSSAITPLDRLSYIGTNGLGALVFEPDFSSHDQSDIVSLDRLAMEAQDVLRGESVDVLQELIALNGSSAGARPKALIGVNKSHDHIIHGASELPGDFEPWMVKFPNMQDGSDAGAIEYVYALLAKKSGIDIPDVYLFPAEVGPGYFAIKRFDRDGLRRYHMHTACGLLHSDFRAPSLDYEDLLNLTAILTRDFREVEKMFRLAVFNVLAHNRDDHSKNFSFLMDEMGQWRVAPAYDLTFSSGPGGEQSTTVIGEGRKPGIPHLIKLAKEANISEAKALEVIESTQSSLMLWTDLAKKYRVTSENIELIRQHLITE